MARRRSLLLLALFASALSFAPQSIVQYTSKLRSRAFATRLASHIACSAAVPKELLEAAWLPKVAEACPFAESKSGDLRMGDVLEWLSVMLVTLDLNESSDADVQTAEEDEEEDELDEDFVNTARPWLHTKEFFDVGVDDMAQALWGHMSAAEYLQPNGSGGSLVLLLPATLPLEVFNEVVATVASVAAQLNPELKTAGCHPDSGAQALRCPVPLVQLFNDNPELLVEGGSASDMSQFL